MSFPQVLATNTSVEEAATTSHTVNLPTGSGGILLGIFSINGSTPGITFPGDWTSVVGVPLGTVLTRIAYKVADGTEGATITVTSSGSDKSAHQSYRIINSDHNVAPVSVVLDWVSGTGTTANPPNLDPSTWDTEDTLWFAILVTTTGINISVDPTNYSNPLENENVSSGKKIRVVRRELNAASENPSAFTLDNAGFRVGTLAVKGGLGMFGRRAFRGGP